MGQRPSRTESRPDESLSRSHGRSAAKLALFQTDLGWFALCGMGRTVSSLSIGHLSAEAARGKVSADSDNGRPTESDWFPVLRRRLERFAAGVEMDFSDCDLDLHGYTLFQKRVLAATRGIAYGATVTYAQLAASAGTPRAARAVGHVMARNPVPILIPCHRVTATGGGWGGYSAPQGVVLKRRLLAMESATAEAESRVSPT